MSVIGWEHTQNDPCMFTSYLKKNQWFSPILAEYNVPVVKNYRGTERWENIADDD